MINTEMSPRSSVLPGLIGLAAAALLWWYGDGWRSDRILVDQQVATTKRLLSSGARAEDRSFLEQRQTTLKQAKADLQSRLSDEADLQLVRARLFYDLRQRCYEVKVNCLIRLGESEPAKKKDRAADSGPEDPLAKLGITRVRATISGQLSEQELSNVLSVFVQDEQRVWRFNRVQLKGRAFEIDIERHVQFKFENS